MLRLDARFRASLEKLGQPLVFETADHESECNACGYALKDAQRFGEQRAETTFEVVTMLATRPFDL